MNFVLIFDWSKRFLIIKISPWEELVSVTTISNLILLKMVFAIVAEWINDLRDVFNYGNLWYSYVRGMTFD